MAGTPRRGWLAAFVGLGLLGYSLLMLAVLWRFGFSGEADFIFLAHALPQVLIQVFTYSILPLLVPALSVLYGKRRSAFCAKVMLVAGLLACVIALVAWALGLSIFGAFFPEFQMIDERRVTFLLLVVSFPLSIIVAVLSAYGHSHGDFLAVEGAASANSLSSGLIFLLVSSEYGVVAFGVAVVSGYLLQLAVLSAKYSRLFGCRVWAVSAPSLRTLLVRSAPVWGVSTITKSDLLIDRGLAAHAGVGAVSSLYLAQQVLGMVSYFLSRLFVVPEVPGWARADLIANRVRSLCLRLALYSAPLFLMVALLAGVALSFFVDLNDVAVEFPLLVILLTGYFFCGLFGQAYVLAFHAKSDSLTPSRIGLFGYALGVLVRYCGVLLFGVYGLAAGISLYYIVNFSLLYYFFGKLHGGRC